MDKKTKDSKAKVADRHALVMVFGDLGHSPRMQNHVRELASMGYSVDFAGYDESELPVDMKSERINPVHIPNFHIFAYAEKFLPSLFSKLLGMAWKVTASTICMLWQGLFILRKPEVIIVQSPPVLPSIFISYILAKWHKARLCIDWHNVGYTILAQGIKTRSVIAIAKAIEVYVPKLADVNFVVSETQREWMQLNAGTSSIVLYDRPVPSRFSPLDKKNRRDFRAEIRGRFGWDKEEELPILVSSTSWTPDEDFDLLVDAIPLIKHKLQLIVTGKGPLQHHYEDKILSLGLTNVQFATHWLSFEDYTKLIASSDLGICLHISSSGVDLPMKAIDMIGAGIPVAAFDYPAINELIQNGRSGFIFKTSEELATVINDFLSYKVTAKPPTLESWTVQWKRIVWPLINQA